MDNEAVLQKIEEIYKSKMWSMYKLSRESGIPQSTISSLFGKRSNISLEKLDKICAAFHITMSQFFAMLEEEPKKSLMDYELRGIMEGVEDLSPKSRRLLNTVLMAMEELDRELKDKDES